MRFTFFTSISLWALAALEASARLDGMDVNVLAQVLNAYQHDTQAQHPAAQPALAQTLSKTASNTASKTASNSKAHSQGDSHSHIDSHSHGDSHSHADAHSHSHADSHSHSHADLKSHSHGDSHSHADSKADSHSHSHGGSESESESDSENGSGSDSDAEDDTLAQVNDQEFSAMLAQIQSKLDEADNEHETMLSEVTEYLSQLGHEKMDAMQNIMAQVQSTNDDEQILAQIQSVPHYEEDHDFTSVAQFLAQCEVEDVEKIASNLAQKFGYDDKDQGEGNMLAQTGVEADDENAMLPKIATFLAQMDEKELDTMEYYLAQMEQAKQSGDNDTLAQLNGMMDENLVTIAEYLTQLDSTEISQINGLIAEKQHEQH